MHAHRECKYRINYVKAMYRSTDLRPRMKFPCVICLLYDTSLGRCVLTSSTTGKYSYNHHQGQGQIVQGRIG
jgi:hypothetical protein